MYQHMGAPMQVLFRHLQKLLSPNTILMADSGDSIFNW
jgi:hypothetical protein